MSLITSASPWTTTSKRTPSIGKRRTQKAVRDNVDYTDFDVDDPDLNLSEPMQSTIAMNEERGKTVNDMLNRITASHAGDDLVDFKPIDTNLAKQRQTKEVSKESFESPMLKRAAGLPEYTPSDMGIDHLSNYTKSYEAGAILGKPYYNKGSSDSSSSSDTALMQKLNYITHILEDIQLEKTSNITEELILYSFLGVFVIFIVDSFARVGKYHR